MGEKITFEYLAELRKGSHPESANGKLFDAADKLLREVINLRELKRYLTDNCDRTLSHLEGRKADLAMALQKQWYYFDNYFGPAIGGIVMIGSLIIAAIAGFIKG